MALDFPLESIFLKMRLALLGSGGNFKRRALGRGVQVIVGVPLTTTVWPWFHLLPLSFFSFCLETRFVLLSDLTMIDCPVIVQNNKPTNHGLGNFMEDESERRKSQNNNASCWTVSARHKDAESVKP